MAISAVGSTYQNHGTGITTVASVNPTTVGDVLVVHVGYGSTSPAVSGLSHSGVTTWTLLERGTGNSLGIEVWMGTVTASGSATLTVSFSPSNSGIGTVIMVQQFTAGLGSGTIWARDGSQAGTTTSASSSTTTFPSLTPASAGELYFGAARTSAGTANSGSTSGYTYVAVTGGASNIAYNPACSSAAQAPTSTITGGPAAYTTAAALITATIAVVAGSPAPFWQTSPLIPILPAVPVGA